MIPKSIISLLVYLLVAVPFVFADAVRITQIDSNSLLFNQQIKLYLSITDDRGEPIEQLKNNNFTLFESKDGRKFQQIPEINSFQVSSNYEEGVSFVLLIDNSESMYWTMEGKKTQNADQRRITFAKKAVKSFLKSINNPKDKVGLAVYNSNYKSFSGPIEDKVEIERHLNDVQRPTKDAIYSEIYGSVNLAVDEFATTGGRKAIIILSDGVNNPSYNHTKKINEQFGVKHIPYQTPLKSLQLEGISLYVINFGKRGDKKDRHLSRIAAHSGGVTFDAHNQRELQQIYLKIMNQILKEYVVTYDATMEPAEKKFVRVKYAKDKKKSTTTRFYLSGTLFGLPSDSVNPLFFIVFLLAIALLWLLSKVKFEKQRLKPSLEIMNEGTGNAFTQILDLGTEETVIGSSPDADMTIAGVPAIEENHATIVFDEKKDQYTLKGKGKGKIKVNNQFIETKILEPGDLIDLDGTTMIFDEGAEK